MADEVTITMELKFSTSNVDVKSTYSSLKFDASGTNFNYQTQSIGTSEEALTLGDVVTPGFMIIKNTDATNFVSLRSGTGATNTIKLKAGEVALFRWSTTAPYAIADTLACVVEYLLIED